MEHRYRLEFRSDPLLWPFYGRQLDVLNNFETKYEALLTANNRLRRGTFHFRSDRELTLKDIKENFPDFKVLGFYEVN